MGERPQPRPALKATFEAEFRGMRIGELIGALIAATMEKDLLQLILILGTKKPANGRLESPRTSEST